MPYSEAANAALAPDASIQLLAGTGTTEAHNTVLLSDGRYATLKVGATAVRVRFRGTVGGTTVVGTTDLIFGAYERFDWVVRKDSTVLYVEAADAASAYQVWVWSSSTKV